MAKDELGDDVAPQQAGQVRQLLAERANAEAYGQTNRVTAVDKQLAELGYVRPAEAPEVSRTSHPAGRASRQDRIEKTADSDETPVFPASRRAPGKTST